MLTIRGLSKEFVRHGRGAGAPRRITALDAVDLDVQPGSFTAVLGPSGCGKTTMLRCIAGFETPDGGTIDIADARVNETARKPVPAHRRGVGIVPQDGALFPHLSVAQNVGFGLSGMSRRRRRERVDEVLELVSLGGFGSQRPHELSGGQQQRVALARALAPRPSVILLDEPFSALDAHLRQSVRTEMRRLLKSLGITVVLVTHDQAEALAMADHLVVMGQGRVWSSGDPRSVYFQPGSIDVGEFLGDAVVLTGDVEMPETGVREPIVRCALGDLSLRSWHGEYGRCQVLIRPEDIAVEPAGAAANPEASEGTGVVVDHDFYGHDELLKVELSGQSCPVSVRVFGQHPYRCGESVALWVNEGVCTFPADRRADHDHDHVAAAVA